MKKKGVSLIVMVITVLTMLIIAGAVILNMIENNPIKSSQKTAFQGNVKNYVIDLDAYIKNATSADLDFDKFDVTAKTYDEISKYIENFTRGDEEYIEIKNGEIIIKADAIKKNEEEVKWLEEIGIKKETNLKIPEGFAYLEGEIDTGFVIKDKTNGNEFVWVPVENIDLFKRTASSKVLGNTTPIINEIASGTEETSENFSAFKQSVTLNKGFYIGRYESSVAENGNIRTVPNAFSYDANVLDKNFVASHSKIKGAYDSSKDVASDVISGTAYDYTISWIAEKNNFSYDVIQVKSAGKGQYSDGGVFAGFINTGSNANYKFNNIYDLAGNNYEFTLEKSDTLYVKRGGSAEFSSTTPFMSRSVHDIVKACPRMVLYYK